jgi:hypothetical protein
MFETSEVKRFALMSRYRKFLKFVNAFRGKVESRFVRIIKYIKSVEIGDNQRGSKVAN